MTHELIERSPRGYIQIPQFPGTVIATHLTHLQKTLPGTLKALVDENQKLSPMPHFMTHRENVRKSMLEEMQLFYADGSRVEESYDLYKQYFGYNGSVGTWLDAKFIKEGLWYIETDLRISAEGFSGRRHPLDRTTLHEEAYVDLEFNSQGLPIRKSILQSFLAEKNIYFHPPAHNWVAVFASDVSCAGMGSSNPNERYPSRGALAIIGGLDLQIKNLNIGGKNES